MTAAVRSSTLIDELTSALEVPPSLYEKATKRYAAVGKWLDADDSPLHQYRPIIYPQGSFALGTVIRPILKNDYDIDAVCLLNIDQSVTTPRFIKQSVGERLRNHGTYNPMLADEGRRCWTIIYADEADDTGFHLDVLPTCPNPIAPATGGAVPQKFTSSSAFLTDLNKSTKSYSWGHCNPIGYAAWFRSRMEVAYQKELIKLAEARRAAVVDVPIYEVQTPLQHVIQILKRHRDASLGNNEHRPISIIITTLAAHAYSGQDDVRTALLAIIPNMRHHVHQINGRIIIPNPVNPLENFADRWEREPIKTRTFFEWLQSLEHLVSILANPSRPLLESTLPRIVGSVDAKNILARLDEPDDAPVGLIESTPIARPSVSMLRNIYRFSRQFVRPYRLTPPWLFSTNMQSVTIRARVKYPTTNAWISLKSNGQDLPKESSLEFTAKTDVTSDYKVHWQIVNTGREALERHQGRGSIENGTVMRTETARYTGPHCIKCYITRLGTCVAMSDDFIINVV